MSGKIIDISNYWQPGPVSDDAALILIQNAFDAGVRRVICGTQRPSVCNQQLVACSRLYTVDMRTDAYVQLEYAREPVEQIAEARDAIDVQSCDTIWLAVEGTWSTNQANNKLYLKECIAQARRQSFKTVGIYTSEQYWLRIMDDTDDFRSFKLWYANYDRIAHLNARMWRAQGFGGWFKPSLKQYKQNVELAGMNVDLNVAA